MNREVTDLNTAIYRPSGGSVRIPFDIPAPTIKEIVDQLKAHGQSLAVEVGVALQPITRDLARAFGLKRLLVR